MDFFPLTVDYEEKCMPQERFLVDLSSGKDVPAATVCPCARLIDRPIRPLFPDGFRNDVQIVATVLSVEQDNPPEIAAMFGASCALTVSDIPFMGPIAGVRVGYINGEFVINPTEEQRADSDLNLTVAGSYDAVMMVEAGANELSEEIVLDAILFGHAEIRRLVEFQQNIQQTCGKEKQIPSVFKVSEELEEKVRSYAEARLDTANTKQR